MTSTPEEIRYRAGLAAYASQFGVSEHEVYETLSSFIGPSMASDGIIATGSAWGEGPLSWRERSIVVISSMVTQGGVDARLAGHMKWGLANGLSRSELEAIIRILAGYVGYPKASVAMELLRSTLDPAPSTDIDSSRVVQDDDGEGVSEL